MQAIHQHAPVQRALPLNQGHTKPEATHWLTRTPRCKEHLLKKAVSSEANNSK